MKRKINTWDMSLKEFISLNRCHNFKRYNQKTSQFSSRTQIGCDFYLYVSIENLTVINPYGNKYNKEKYKSFFSSMSADDCKEKAYNWIQEIIKI